MPALPLSAFVVALSVAALAAPSGSSPHSSDGPADGRASLHVPAGYVLLMDSSGRLVASAVAAAAAGSQWEVKECVNDERSTWWQLSKHGIASNEDYPLGENIASEGECPAETHYGPVTYLQFSTRGEHYGGFELQGKDYYDKIGHYWVWCTPVAAALGAPGLGSWGTYVTGRDNNCEVETKGSQPHEWVEWSGVVVNYHFTHGSDTRILIS